MKTVLVAEDNPFNLELMQQLLEDDYVVIVAHDGVEALELAREKLPDLILMDISMPRMHGLDATRHLREDERTRHIPIIALTAHAIRGDRDRAIEAGVDDYLTKPVDDDLLAATIEKWISGRHPVG